MSIKKIKEHNSQQFLNDLKKVSDVMVITTESNAYLHVSKKELRKEAEKVKINYYMTDKIFRRVRNVMVIM
jgi:protein tyrosine/serine phosphatase